MDPFNVADGRGRALPKICDAYRTMISLGTIIAYLETQPLSSTDISTFSIGNQQLLLHQEIQTQITY